MKVGYLEQRECFGETLRRTLAAGWSEQYGREIHVMESGGCGGRSWFFHPHFSVYYGGYPGEQVRRFLYARFRYNTRRPRPAQGLLAYALSLPVGLRLVRREAFRVRGDLPSTEHLLVLPGNNRIRVFDFHAGDCRVLLKHGFSNETMKREIEVRRRREGPFPRIHSWSESFSWFEEPILDAVPISRCASSSFRLRAESRAFDLLEKWLTSTSREMAADVRIRSLLHEIRRDGSQLAPRLGAHAIDLLLGTCDVLAQHAAALRSIRAAEVHGDLILSNILVSEASDEVYIVDWERCQERFFWYDHLVYGLRSRYVDGLAGRVQDFAEGRIDREILRRVRDLDGRRVAVAALFLLEDLAFQLQVNAAAPFLDATDELKRFIAELGKLQSSLRRWNTLS